MYKGGIRICEVGDGCYGGKRVAAVRYARRVGINRYNIYCIACNINGRCVLAV